ncbi:hypothetical protein RclHR1_14750004 [Rhizophagus clarus]|uniref:Uncharacterized protein n=1 Tax=Rhizophagus clarus TaxID=94130 RepID=A0A2Z6QDG8_9GLOM|nr:hypothetical protein RclHR1_14750004 [Rhizophagus clarus]GET03606.1 hypothetical protein RCL_jg22561.t1 [Rhizophagus clarus]
MFVNTESKLLKIGEIVDEIIKQTGIGLEKSCPFEKLEYLVQELKKYGIYWTTKQVYDRFKRKRSGSERKNGALGPMVSSNETVINNNLPLLNHGDSKDYTRISSILNNDDNDATATATATATTTSAATATITATTMAISTATITATTAATPNATPTAITATAIVTTIATTTATATATAIPITIAIHTAPFDPIAVLPPIDSSMYQNDSPKLPTLQPDHIMEDQTSRVFSFSS